MIKLVSKSFFNTTHSLSSELFSKSDDVGSHLLTSASNCLTKGFQNTMLADWQAKHRNPICF